MLNPQLKKTLKEIENFEATKSMAKTGTGSRREGRSFEVLVRRMWYEFAEYLIKRGVQPGVVQRTDKEAWVKLTKGRRSIILPCNAAPASWEPVENPPSSWLRLTFDVDAIFAKFPTLSTMMRKYAPSHGPYAKGKYLKLFHGLKTKFDDTLVLEENGVLAEKILFEYKTGKASKHRQIDGNAHERLSFQIMQYLEVALQYPRCSLTVLTNGAFARYRNKYHPSFHAQADRLEAFSWFRMRYLSMVPEYGIMLSMLAKWILGAKP